MTFHDRLISELTQMDQRASKRRGYNHYALAQYFEAAQGVTDAKSFSESFTACAAMLRVAKKLGLGLEVKGGFWELTQ